MMRKFLVLTMLGFWVSLVAAQTTAVTATVTDSDGQTWNNGSWSLVFTPNPSNPSIDKYNINGAPLNPSITNQSGVMNGAGTLSFSAYQNGVITPVGSTWTLTYCPNSITKCSVYNFSTGLLGSLDLSSVLSTLSTAPRFLAVSGTYGYLDVEASVQLIPGSTYFNVTTSCQRVWSGSSWGCSSTGAGVYVPISGGTMTGALFLNADPTTALGAVTKQYADKHPFSDPLGFGCVPNSTVTGVMTANVNCLQTLGNAFGRIQLPAGQWNINSCAAFTNQGGFILEGAGVNATSIIQQTNGTCALSTTTGANPNEFRISDMTIGHANIQTPPVDSATNSAAPAIFFSGPHGASIFNYELHNLAFTKSSRGIELDKTISGTSWGYDIQGIRGNSDLQGATINLCGTGAGNPRVHLFRIFSTQYLTTEPAICVSQSQQLGIDDIEITPSGSVPGTLSLPAMDLSGTSDGRVTNVHIENYTVGVTDNRLIAAENSNISFENIGAAVILCPAPFTCHGFGSANTTLVSNVAGGGSINLKNFTLVATPSPTGISAGFMYGLKTTANVTVAECSGMRTDSFPSTYTASCLYPTSDVGLYTRINNTLQSPTSLAAAATWAITSVATSGGGAAVYTGTFTGCNQSGQIDSLVQGFVNVSGFVATPANNGLFRIRSCNRASTAITLINGNAVAETHAATGVMGVSPTGFVYYSRYWDGAASQLSTYTHTVNMIYNPTTSVWDSFLVTNKSDLQTNAIPWTSNDWTWNWTCPGGVSTNVTPLSPGLCGYMRSGGFAPADTVGAVPTTRLGRNLGGVFVNYDIRGTSDGSGRPELDFCAQTNAAAAIYSEAMPALGACQANIDYQGSASHFSYKVGANTVITSAATGANILYRCTVAGTLRAGQTTTVPGDCGTAVDTHIKVD